MVDIGQNWPRLLCISCSPGFALGFIGLHMLITFIDMIYEWSQVDFSFDNYGYPEQVQHRVWLFVDAISFICLIIASVGVCNGNARTMVIGMIMAIIGSGRRVRCIVVILYYVLTYPSPTSVTDYRPGPLPFELVCIYIFGFTFMLLSHILEAMTLYKLRKFTKQGDDDEESG